MCFPNPKIYTIREDNMYTWNVFERNVTNYVRCTISANTKIEAEEIAFQMFNRPMTIDLNRKDNK